jgi:hypothetical protein
MPHSFWDIEMSEYPMKKSKTYDECGFELHYIEYNKFQYELINLSTGDCYDVHETNGYLNQKVGNNLLVFTSPDTVVITKRSRDTIEAKGLPF